MTLSYHRGPLLSSIKLRNGTYVYRQVKNTNRRISIKAKILSRMIGVIAIDETLKESVAFRDVLFLRKTIAAEKQEFERADSLRGVV